MALERRENIAVVVLKSWRKSKSSNWWGFDLWLSLVRSLTMTCNPLREDLLPSPSAE